MPLSGVRIKRWQLFIKRWQIPVDSRGGLMVAAAVATRSQAPARIEALRAEITACCVGRMSKQQDRMIAGFTTGERGYIRRELDVVFSTLPSVAEGCILKTWRGGRDAGKPKLSPTAKGLIARGLMRLDNGGHFPRLFFTESGLTALRAMMTDPRIADPKKFAHVRQELGIDPGAEDATRD